MTNFHFAFFITCISLISASSYADGPAAVIASGRPPVFTSPAFTANVMAPLSIGDVAAPSASASAQSWLNFRQQLRAMKKMGIHAISTDVWWGVVEGVADGQFT